MGQQPFRKRFYGELQLTYIHFLNHPLYPVIQVQDGVVEIHGACLDELSHGFPPADGKCYYKSIGEYVTQDDGDERKEQSVLSEIGLAQVCFLDGGGGVVACDDPDGYEEIEVYFGLKDEIQWQYKKGEGLHKIGRKGDQEISPALILGHSALVNLYMESGGFVESEQGKDIMCQFMFKDREESH